jgi:hypothetical protein
MGEIDMNHAAFVAFIEGTLAAGGVVHDLVRHGDHARRQVGTDRSYRGHRHDVRDAMRV